MAGGSAHGRRRHAVSHIHQLQPRGYGIRATTPIVAANIRDWWADETVSLHLPRRRSDHGGIADRRDKMLWLDRTASFSLQADHQRRAGGFLKSLSIFESANRTANYSPFLPLTAGRTLHFLALFCRRTPTTNCSYPLHQLTASFWPSFGSRRASFRCLSTRRSASILSGQRQPGVSLNPKRSFKSSSTSNI